jgi:5-methyltetrahydrofolate--homocysteine methyltransferase
MGYTDDISSAVYEGDEEKVKQLIEDALSAGIPADEILHKGLVHGMDRVGGRFKQKEMFLPEVIMSGEAMKAGTVILKPHLVQKQKKNEVNIVIGTVKDDVHDIGKSIVIMMLEGAGFKVTDLGVDVPVKKFIQAVKDTNARVLGISALLTSTKQRMLEVIDALKETGLRKSVKVIIGGAPITDGFARGIGADAYAVDAGAAVDEVRKLVGA